jgi:hypothetical protein
MAKTAWKFAGMGGVCTGHPGIPFSEHGMTTGR